MLIFFRSCYIPGHVFEKVDAKSPTIVVSGLCRKYEKYDLVNCIESQNEEIKALGTVFECDDVCEEDKLQKAEGFLHHLNTGK